MTLDDKVDLILNKLNGSEGSELRTDIQAWLTQEHSNAVDNQLIVNELLTNELIRQRAQNNADIFIITARGRRINDKGGWKKHQTRNRWDQIKKNVITYTNIGFGALNIVILIYSLNQNNRLERELERQGIDLEKQHEIKDQNNTRIDSLKKTIQRQSKVISKMDSTITQLKSKPK